MKAIITQELARKSWSGRTLIPIKIIGTKENIIEKVNDYITEELKKQPPKWIPTKCFHVEIFNHHGKKVNGWEYSPTYR